MLKCGLAQVDITPPIGTFIPGYFHERLVSDVLDTLYAKAMILDNGSARLCLVSLDALNVLPEVSEGIRKRVRAFTGIEESNVMVTAIHTHTGGACSHHMEKMHNADYVPFLIQRAADAAILASKRMGKARIGFGVGSEGTIAFQRRYYMKDGSLMTNPPPGSPDIAGPAGPIDPTVLVARIDDEDGKPVAVLTNYACHPDCIDGTEISADYPGELSRAVREALGDHVLNFFLLGACGNINSFDVNGTEQRPKGHYKKMGRVLAAEALRVHAGIATDEKVTLSTTWDGFTADRRRATVEDVKNAHMTLRTIPERKVDYWDTDQVERYFANQLLKLEKANQSHQYIEIQALRIGELAIVGLPCELFVDFGLALRQKACAPYLALSTLTNGSSGYISIPEAFSQGGYEVRISGDTCLAPDTGEKLVETALRAVRTLFA